MIFDIFENPRFLTISINRQFLTIFELAIFDNFGNRPFLTILKIDDFRPFLNRVIFENLEMAEMAKKFEHGESPLVELQPEKKVFQGKILTLVCDIKKGAPEPTLTWEKDGNVLASNSKIYISPDRSQLQIFSIQVSDAGLYKCVGDNIAGHTEASTKVEVLQSPKLEESFEEIEAVESDDLELSCISDVKPLPEVTW